MPTPISALRADIVPHEEWALRKWFYADPLWYYHRSRTDERIVPNTTFYDLVDPRLRDLCRLLNENGLHTTPSCQGHFYPRDRFELIWSRLVRQQHLIRAAGLVVTDSETPQQFLFRDPAYALPWRTFDDFFAQINQHQGYGYLGILLPCDCREVIDRLRPLQCDTPALQIHFDDRAGKLLGGTLLSIRVRPKTPRQRDALWEAVTRRFEQILSRTTCATP